MRDRPFYYRRDGTPYSDFLEWAQDFEGERHVGKTNLPNGYRVSTVWLGMDHNFLGKGPPLIFETMVFPKDSFQDQDMERYSTEEEAKAGHERMVQKWKGEKSCTKKKWRKEPRGWTKTALAGGKR